MTELLIVLALIVINGVFALSELAIVSARQTRLKTMVAAGRKGAETALSLATNPGRFLSSVQIGITLVGIINGVYSGEAFGSRAYQALRDMGLQDTIAAPLGYGSVIAVITYLSVIAGELVPKNLALRHPEAIACWVAPMMSAFSRIAAPAVWLLDTSTRLVFSAFGQSTEKESQVTDEEIAMLVAEAEASGVLETHEREMISGVMRLADRTVIALMTPRTDVDWVDVQATPDHIRDLLIRTPHSLLPVGEGSIDTLIGVVQARELLASVLSGQALDIRPLIRKVPIIPETMHALDALAVLREADVPIALIHDEYGNFEGLLTPTDTLEAIVGAFKSEDEDPDVVTREDGSILLSGSMPVDAMADVLGIALPAKRNFTTVAGYVLAHLRHIPRTGEFIDRDGWRFEVVDLDARRIDKVLVTRPQTASEKNPPAN